MKKNKELFIQVICIKNCRTFNNTIFYIDKIYKCQIIEDSAHIYSENNIMVKVAINRELNMVKFSDHFMTLKEYRKLKLEKLNG